MRQTLIFIKRKLQNKGKLFLPVLFLALFLFPVSVSAQTAPGTGGQVFTPPPTPTNSSTTINYAPFKCLFERTDSNCSPSNDEAAIGRGEASGVLYGQTNSFTDTGVTAITMKIGLWVDLVKERTEPKYYFGRVADSRNSSFFLKLNYLIPGTSTPLSYFETIPYQEDNFQISSSFILGPTGVNSVNSTTVNGGLAQTKIAFYKVGPSGYEVVTQQIVLSKITLDNGLEIPYGEKVEAELWYCGGQKGNSSTIDGRYAPREVGKVEYFTTDGKYVDINGQQSGAPKYYKEMCGGTAAYKIGATRTFNLPSNKAEAQASSEENIQSGITASTYIGSTLPLCSITPFGDGSVMGCVAQILYSGVFRPVAFFAQVMGKLFDFFIGYSLSDESYRHDFIQTGWQLVRDISNIFFIIIMIYSGLAAVFSTSNVSYKKVIPTLIINALIINFSLFATRLVIDMSNITARIFYNQMVVKVDGEAADGTTGFKPISEAIVSSFNPQKIFEGSVLQSESATLSTGQNTESDPTTFNGQADVSQQTGGFKRYSKEYAGYFALVTLVAIAISFGVAMMFWKTAFLFVGRVIGLYVAMIFSPFAFLSRGSVPLVGKLPAINFTSWWKDLSNYAILAPIFVFFLYIINSFLNVEFFTKVGLDQNGQGFFGSVMYVVIPMLIIYGLVTRGVKIAESLGGEFGKMVQGFATKAVGIGAGVALGGTALIGRGAMGIAGKGLGKWAAVNKDTGGAKGFAAGGVNKFLQWGQKSSLDVRNTKAFGALGGLGIKADDKFAGLMGLGQKDALGGNVKARQDRDKKKEKRTTEKNDMSHLTDKEAEEVWAKISERKAKEMAENKWEEDNLNKKVAGNQTIQDLKTKEEDLKKDLETAKTTNNAADEKTAKEALTANAKAQSDAMAPLVLAMLEERKENKHHATDEYKTSLQDSKDKIAGDYGKVTSAKDLSAAMRYEYAQRMLEDSMYLSKGNKRRLLDPGAGGVLGGLAGFGFGVLGTGSVGGALFANYIDDQQDSEKRVFEKIVKDFNKSHDPSKNRAVKLQKKLDEINSMIDSSIENMLEGTGRKLSDLKPHEKEEEFGKARSRSEIDAQEAKFEYEEFQKSYRSKKKAGSATKAEEEELFKLANKHRKAKDHFDSLNNAEKDRDRHEADLEKEKDKQKSAEDKKKGDKSGDKPDKPKES